MPTNYFDYIDGFLHPDRRLDFPGVFRVLWRGDGPERLRILSRRPWGALMIVMLVIFLLGFILDFIEITFVVVHVGPQWP